MAIHGRGPTVHQLDNCVDSDAHCVVAYCIRCFFLKKIFVRLELANIFPFCVIAYSFVTCSFGLESVECWKTNLMAYIRKYSAIFGSVEDCIDFYATDYSQDPPDSKYQLDYYKVVK